MIDTEIPPAMGDVIPSLLTTEAAPSLQVIEMARQAAVIAARDAIEDHADSAARLESDLVGELEGSSVEDDTAYTLRFEAFVDGYRGWVWSVTMGMIDATHPTVSEVVLLPGPEALLAPDWVPWEERVRSEDLRAGDLLPVSPDDQRLVPAYVQSDDPAVEEVAVELGLGRVRVMSRFGRHDAADRWHGGAFGPNDAMAKSAPGPCITCAFYLPLGGSLGSEFGVCGNQYSPADGRVVNVAFGCGAHSEGKPRAGRDILGDVVIDELALEVHQRDDGDDGDDNDDGDDGDDGDVAPNADAVATDSDGAAAAGAATAAEPAVAEASASDEG